MAETKTDEQTETEDGSGSKFGRVLDITAVCAGVVLGVIVFDVLSGGRISRFLSRGKGPCEGCQDKAEVPDPEASRDG